MGRCFQSADIPQRGMRAEKRYLLLVLALFPVFLLFAAEPALAQSIDDLHRVKVGRTVPPNGYVLDELKPFVENGTVANPNPPLDYDLDGNGKKTAWSIPITIKDSLGKNGNWLTADEMGTEAFLVGIPDPKGANDPKFLGWGEDHYSPRIKRTGDPTEGLELGRCKYNPGRNTWILLFKDVDHDNVPDQFLSSVWETRNPTDDESHPTFGHMTTFVADLKVKKISVVETVEKPMPPEERELDPDLSTLFAIKSAAIMDLAPALPGGLAKLGQQIGAEAILAQRGEDRPPIELNVLQEPTGTVLVGQPFTVLGQLTNTDEVSHRFYFAAYGLHASIDSSLPPVVLSPGETLPYAVQATALQPGWASVSVLAWSDALTSNDGTVYSTLVNAEPAR